MNRNRAVFVYWAQKSVAGLSENRVMDVSCDNCGHEYHYLLTRAGLGIVVVPYGVTNLDDWARRKARKLLQRRLLTDAELVPCPKCQWISDSLVVKHRRHRYESYGRNAWKAAIVVIAIALVAAWAVMLDDGKEIRRLIPYLLCYTPAAAIAFAGGLMMLARIRRRLIQPNRDYPAPPRLPPGTPPALTFDAETETYSRAATTVSEEFGRQPEWLVLRLGAQTLPPVCCDCRRPASEGIERKLAPELAALEISRCSECHGRAKRWSRLIYGATLLRIGPLGLLCLLLTSEPLPIILSLCGSLMVGLVVAELLREQAASPGRLRIVDRTRCVAKARFPNLDFMDVAAKELRRQI